MRYTVVAVDSVRHLVAIAREKHHTNGGAPNLSFHHLDVACDALPAAGTFDVLVSMHTLYWHPDPGALLAACRRALKPGGHAIFLTYNRPARVIQTIREVRREPARAGRAGHRLAGHASLPAHTQTRGSRAPVRVGRGPIHRAHGGQRLTEHVQARL